MIFEYWDCNRTFSIITCSSVNVHLYFHQIHPILIHALKMLVTMAHVTRRSGVMATLVSVIQTIQAITVTSQSMTTVAVCMAHVLGTTITITITTITTIITMMTCGISLLLLHSPMNTMTGLCQQHQVLGNGNERVHRCSVTVSLDIQARFVIFR